MHRQASVQGHWLRDPTGPLPLRVAHVQGVAVTVSLFWEPPPTPPRLSRPVSCSRPLRVLSVSS